MLAKSTPFVFSLLLGLVAGCAGGSSSETLGASTQIPPSQPSEGVFGGLIRDSAGQPVAGARVSVRGVEAVTGPDGTFRIEEPALANGAGTATPGSVASAITEQQDIAVLKDGFEAFTSKLVVEDGDELVIDLVGAETTASVEVTSHVDGQRIVLDAACLPTALRVEGFAGVEVDSQELDLVLVLDRSGSTERIAFDVDGDEVEDSVLQAEVHAATCFLQGLDPRTTRVGVVTFSNAAQRVADFGTPAEAAASLVDFTPSGGTNFEAAMREAEALFAELALADLAAHQAEPHEEGAAPPPAPRRAVVLLSDGIPTTYGYPDRIPFDSKNAAATSNLTWHPDDSAAAIAAAGSLADNAGARLFAYSVIPADDPGRARKTLPHCVARAGGRYTDLTTVEGLTTTLCAEPVSVVLSVEVRDLTAGSAPVEAVLHSGGRFTAVLPLDPSAGVPVGDGSFEHELDVAAYLRSGSGVVEGGGTRVKVHCMSSDAPLVPQAPRADTKVADLVALLAPQGDALNNDELRGHLASEFEDAVELPDVETFDVPEGEETVTLSIDFTYRDSGVRSDFGYVVLDPSDMPADSAEALAGVTEDNLLFSSGDFPGSGGSIGHGQAHTEVQVPAGSVVCFVMTRGRTLLKTASKPNQGNPPLFSLSYLNPGAGDQAMTFVSDLGRTAPGASLEQVTQGPLMIFAFEDMPITSNADKDFQDVVFTVNGIGARLDAPPCPED